MSVKISKSTTDFATWLILASGICLSKRLSHASLSISDSDDETANGSVKTAIISSMVTYYTDNRSNSRANTCHKRKVYLVVPIR